ncbi:hypothetical protein D3C72_1455340 [compost metagenome]
MSGTDRITGSRDRSSHADEYSVSALGLTTSAKLASGNVRLWLKVLAGVRSAISSRVTSISTIG